MLRYWIDETVGHNVAYLISLSPKMKCDMNSATTPGVYFFNILKSCIAALTNCFVLAFQLTREPLDMFNSCVKVFIICLTQPSSNVS
jgi:hypothetical protein